MRNYPDSYSYERAIRLGVSVSGIKHAKKRIEATYKKTLNHPKEDPEKNLRFSKKLKN
ncbi:IS630 transposase-related protein [Holospora undulata]|uniref:IS630 transposase-related protein n=1 Tax=Holospora undulata TaxID=1169117 RepID=UPI00094B4C58|nr:IS630 transposase-related protein [Holospora undulata]